MVAALESDLLSGRPVRVAVLGLGDRGSEYLGILRSGHLNATAVAGVDHSTAVRSAMVGVYGDAVPVFADVHSLLDAREELGIDACIVATPPISHAPLAIAALEKSIPVLCEKPLAPNRPGLHMIRDASERYDVLLAMSSPFRFCTAVARAKEMIDGGDLGDIVLFRTTLTTRTEMRGRWNAKPEISGGGVIIDYGTHAVDLTRHLIGPIRHVIAVDTRRLQKLLVEDTAQVLVKTESGATGTLDLSWTIESDSPWFMTIEGTQGSLKLGWNRAEYNFGDGWESFGDGHDRAGSLVRQIEDFVECVRYSKTPMVTADDAQASVSVIDAAYRSMHTGSWTRVVEERRVTSR